MFLIVCTNSSLWIGLFSTTGVLEMFDLVLGKLKFVTLFDGFSNSRVLLVSSLGVVRLEK